VACCPFQFRKDDDVANEQLPGKQLSAHGAARRRFTRAGAAASGVLLTLHSQPGMAAAACTTPSGFHSLTYGSHNPRVTTCSGLSPGIWKNSLRTVGKGNHPGGGDVKWPVSPDTLFSTWFVPHTDQASTLGASTTTLKVVLENEDSWFDPNNLGAHMVAACLNYLSNRSPVPTKDTLVLIWNALRDNGEYVPNAGATPWDVEQVKTYLRSTMG
jgi:hypothetical protein